MNFRLKATVFVIQKESRNENIHTLQTETHWCLWFQIVCSCETKRNAHIISTRWDRNRKHRTQL